MATQTKADRQAAAKKAAATRKRNQTRSKAQTRGTKAAASRQQNKAASNLEQAQSAAKGAVSGLGNAAKLVGGAAIEAGKAVATRVSGGKR